MKTQLEIIAGLLAIQDSVTTGQERECRAYWVPLARDTLRTAGVDLSEARARATKEAEVARRASQ